MGQTAVAQINARLPRELKESGDAGLQALGISPSDAIRALWRRLAEGERSLEEVEVFLFGKEPMADRPSPAFGQSELAQGWQLVDENMAKLGIAAPARGPESEYDDNDLVAQALEGRMRERGLM